MLSIPAGYTLSGARLKFPSDNRSRWYLNGVLVADLNSSFANTVAVSTSSLVPGANLLAVAVSNANSNLDRYAVPHADGDLYRDSNSNTHADPNVVSHIHFHADADSNTDLDSYAHANTYMDVGANLRAIERAMSALGVVCAIHRLARADVAHNCIRLDTTLCAHILRYSAGWHFASPPRRGEY